MELIELMAKRRSVRKYTGEDIPEEKLEKVLQAAILAPTSMNKRPWEFYLVKDLELLKTLSKAKKHGAALIEGCNAAVAVFADSELSDVWVEDCSIALAYMELMANEQGLRACWVQMRKRLDEAGNDAEQNVRDALGVSEKYGIVGIMALGMPAEKKEPYSLDELKWEKVHR